MPMTDAAATAAALRVHGGMLPRFDEILTPDALDFVAELTRRFGSRRAELLQARAERYASGSPGARLGFRDDTAKIRSDPNWRVASPAPGLEDRRCEMTGPPSRKMTINALNSGAKAWMADFEDATAPSWFNVVDGQLNLFDALRGQIDFTDETGKRYEVGAVTPTVLVRPRGWHLDEKHLTLDGQPVPGAFVDFGLYFFHNAETLIASGAGPYFYLPKMESHLEARLWNDVFSYAEDRLEIPYGSDPGHLPDRDHAGRLRDGGDPLRTARPLVWPQRRPLGLHLLHDQELRRGRRSSAARPQPGDHDLAVHGRVRRAAGQDLPRPRGARDRRDGGVRAQQGETRTPPRPRWRRPPPTSPGRSGPVSTVPGSPIRRWSRPASTRSRRCSATARTSSSGSATTSSVTART